MAIRIAASMSLVACGALGLRSTRPDSLDAVGANVQPHAFESISTNVQALEQRLSEIEVENEQMLVNHKYEFEKKLGAMQKGNAATESANKKLGDEIQDLNKQNSNLRERAQALQSDIAAQKRDAQVLRTNLTTVLEFANGTMDKLGRNKWGLHVLQELDQADKEQSAMKEQKRRLEEITKAAAFGTQEKVAVLQTQASIPGNSLAKPVEDVTDVSDAQELVKTLNGNLKELAGDYKTQDAELNAQFQHAFDQEDKRHTWLLKKQKELNATKVTARELHKRLTIAVKLLEQDLDHFVELGKSVRMYAQQLGIRPIIHSFEGSTHASMDSQESHAEKQTQQQPNAKAPLVEESDAEADGDSDFTDNAQPQAEATSNDNSTDGNTETLEDSAQQSVNDTAAQQALLNETSNYTVEPTSSQTAAAGGDGDNNVSSENAGAVSPSDSSAVPVGNQSDLSTSESLESDLAPPDLQTTPQVVAGGPTENATNATDLAVAEEGAKTATTEDKAEKEREAPPVVTAPASATAAEEKLPAELPSWVPQVSEASSEIAVHERVVASADKNTHVQAKQVAALMVNKSAAMNSSENGGTLRKWWDSWYTTR